MHTQKQNDNYKRWRRCKQLLETQGARNQRKSRHLFLVGVTRWQDFFFYFYSFFKLNNSYLPKNAEQPRHRGNQLWTFGGRRWSPCGGSRPLQGGTTREGDKLDCCKPCECKIYDLLDSLWRICYDWHGCCLHVIPKQIYILGISVDFLMVQSTCKAFGLVSRMYLVETGNFP